jgi:hypothetical protein
VKERGGEEGERERERALGCATTPRPSILRLILNAAALASARPTLLISVWDKAARRLFNREMMFNAGLVDLWNGK